MADSTTPGGTSTPLTVDDAAKTLFDLLSDPSEDPDDQGSAADPNAEAAEGEGAADPAKGDGDEPDPKDGKSEEAEEEAAEEPEKPQTYRVKVRGEEIEVTLDELQRGYSRTRDYTEKTQELAEQRRKFETDLASVRGQREQYDGLLGQMDEALKELAPEEPNWEAVHRDYPEQYTAIRARWDAIKQRRETIKAERDRIAAEKAAEAKATYEAHVRREHESLLAAVPEWRDEKVARSEARMVGEFAREMGFSDAEIKGVTDHRALRVMRLAALAHKAGKQKSAPPKAGEPKIKPATPGSGKDTAVPQKVAVQRRAFDRLAKHGSIDAATDAFLTMIPDR